MVYSDGRIAQCRIRNHPNGEVDLNADHPRGKDKAHVFATVLGLTRNEMGRDVATRSPLSRLKYSLFCTIGRKNPLKYMPDTLWKSD